MSTSDIFNKQIKSLAANSKLLTSIINENEIMDLFKSIKFENSNKSGEKNQRLYSEKDIYFDSMLQVTNFILYDDYPNQTEFTSKRKYLQTSRCDYQLTKSELKEIDSFARELDTIENDLLNIKSDIVSYKKSYLVYCETLMMFIDQKEVLMSLFLNYYEEYFLQKNEENDKDFAINRFGSKSSCSCKS